MDKVRFAMLGVAGYIARKHLKAIKDVGGELVCACDPNSSVGFLDSDFPDCRFFLQESAFWGFVDGFNYRQYPKIKYVIICTPNYMHFRQVNDGIKARCNVICEKPVVIEPEDLSGLIERELDANRHHVKQCRVRTIMQLRHHPAIEGIKLCLDTGKKHQMAIHYVTHRGDWYGNTWKTNPELSGGLAINIGVHLFDLLYYLFGDVLRYEVITQKHNRCAGTIELQAAEVTFMLSIEREIKPERTFYLNGCSIDLSNGFTELHTKSYEEILRGRGFSLSDCVPGLALASAIAKTKLDGN